MPKSVFFSFHYDNDFWRTQQVRNMGVIEGSAVATPNDWESIKRSGDVAVNNWIDNSLKYKKCTIVLIGSQTSQRYWVKQEIIKSWDAGKGVFGINIHNLKDVNGRQTSKGNNPFANVRMANGSTLDYYANVYDPPYYDSKDVYGYISRNIESWIDTAIRSR